MISLANTPSFKTVKMTGDKNDFESLSSAIQLIVGEEGEYGRYDHIRLFLMDFCEELRRAVGASHTAVLLHNGIKNDKEEYAKANVLPEKNVHYQIEKTWPELLFIGFVLNDFIGLSVKDAKHFWDITPATIRKFQGVISEILEETVGENKFRLLKGSLTPTFIGYYENYILQYIDHLQLEALKMPLEKRQSHLSIIAKRIAVKDDNYVKVKRQVETLALKEKIAVADVKLPV